MSQYANPQKRPVRSVKHPQKGKRHPLLIFLLLILTCATIWIIGSYRVRGSAELDGVMVTDYPLPAQERITQTTDTPLPYQSQVAVQSFTFAQLAAISNDLLLLVNPEYAVPDYIFGDLARISSYVNALNSDMLLNENALVMLRAMFDSAASIGFTQFRVTQGFRTHEYQQNLYNQMEGTGLAAPPGHSEHQVGLAVDISYQGVNIGNSAQGSWLMDHSYRYGFILRYPQHKTHITGVPFEPWHYRYVGQPHAYFMMRNDMVMEEYLTHLRTHREITIVFEDVEFTVLYLCNEYETLEIPEGNQFWASRDNTGGIIVTITNS